MALNPNIILAGQPVDVMGAVRQGNAAAAETNALRMQNDLTNLYKTQGAQILAGDAGALNALAGFDPMAAMDIQAKRQDMTFNQRRFEILNAQEQRAIETFKATKTAAEAQAAAAQIEDAVKMGLAIQDPAQWDAVMAQQAPELVGQFANRQALAMKYMTMAEALKATGPTDPTAGAPSGYMWKDPNNRAAGVAPLQGYERTPGVVVNTGDLGGARAEIGTVPQGFAAIPDPNSPAGYRMERIPGGPEDMTLKNERAAGNAATASSVITNAATRALSAAKDRAIGNIGQGIVALNPYTDSAEVQRQVDVLKSNATIENLTAMRAASPTGGALGSVTQQENQMLAAKAGALDPSSPYFERDLKEYTLTLLKIIHGEEVGQQVYEQTVEGQSPSRGQTPAPQNGSPQIPPGAIDILRQNNTPEYRKFFDEVFGQGAAAQVLGGN